MSSNMKIKNIYPNREAFGWNEYLALIRCASSYRLRRIDPLYDGEYQKRFEYEFTKHFRSKQSRLVSSGTSAIYVALKSLSMPIGSSVLVSSITDGGCISAIIEAGFKPVLVDTGVKTFNINLESVIRAFDELKSQNLNPPTCLVACHIGGEPITDISDIAHWCETNGIHLIEDCSQAIMAQVKNGIVGSFGKLSAFSLMYRKNVSSAGSAGIILVNDTNYYERVLAFSDRGKPIWRRDSNLNNPSFNLFSALNHNSNEFTASIALSSLRRLDSTNEKRRRFCTYLLAKFKESGIPFGNEKFDQTWAPFYLTLFGNGIEEARVKSIASRMLDEFKVPLLVNYGCLASEWPWLKSHLVLHMPMSEAKRNIENSFNLMLNEKYTLRHADKILQAAKKSSGQSSN